MSNFVRVPSIYMRLAWATFIGESPNLARTMNVRGTANASASGGNTKREDELSSTAHLVIKPGPRPTRNDYPAIERSRARLS